MAHFTEQDFRNVLPAEFSEAVLISVHGVPNTAKSVLLAFQQASQLIAPMFIEPRPFTIIFGTSPFKLSSGLSNITIEFINGTEHLCTDSRIYIDYQNLQRSAYELQVTAILEELCHHIFNVKDEDLVSTIVCKLYPKVAWNGSVYSVV